MRSELSEDTNEMYQKRLIVTMEIKYVTVIFTKCNFFVQMEDILLNLKKIFLCTCSVQFLNKRHNQVAKKFNNRRGAYPGKYSMLMLLQGTKQVAHRA